MSRSHSTHSTATIIAGIDGDVQVVLDHDYVVLDVQGESVSTDGRNGYEHGLVRLSPDAVDEFIDKLEELRTLRRKGLSLISRRFQFHLWEGNLP